MKSLKKLTALLLSGLFILCSTACADKSWAMKTDSQTLSSGIYRYYLFEAYQQGVYELSFGNEDLVKDLKGQTIDGKDAEIWVKDTAVEACKTMLANEKIFKDKGLSLTDEEMKEAQENTDIIWEKEGATFNDKLGIDKDSFHQVYSIYPLEVEKIFDITFGKEAPEQTSNEEINKFYNENYINVLSYSKVAYEATTDDDGTDHSNDTEEKINEQFNSYVEMINSGAKTVNEVSQIIMQTDSLDHDPLDHQLIKKDSHDQLAQANDPTSNLVNLEVGKAVHNKYNDVHFLYIKQDNSSYPFNSLSPEDLEEVVYQMNMDKLENMTEDTKKDMQFTLNEPVINGFDISIFAQNSITTQ